MIPVGTYKKNMPQPLVCMRRSPTRKSNYKRDIIEGRKLYFKCSPENGTCAKLAYCLKQMKLSFHCFSAKLSITMLVEMKEAYQKKIKELISELAYQFISYISFIISFPRRRAAHANQGRFFLYVLTGIRKTSRCLHVEGGRLLVLAFNFGLKQLIRIKYMINIRNL